MLKQFVAMLQYRCCHQEGNEGGSPAASFPLSMLDLARGSRTTGLISGRTVSRRFAGGGDILRPSDLHQFLGSLDVIRSIAMHGKEDASFLHAALISLCFIFGDAEADERAGKPTHGAAHTNTRQSCHDWASGDKRANSGNGQRADARQQAECSAKDCSRACSRGSAL